MWIKRNSTFLRFYVQYVHVCCVYKEHKRNEFVEWSDVELQVNTHSEKMKLKHEISSSSYNEEMFSDAKRKHEIRHIPYIHSHNNFICQLIHIHSSFQLKIIIVEKNLSVSKLSAIEHTFIFSYPAHGKCKQLCTKNMNWTERFEAFFFLHQNHTGASILIWYIHLFCVCVCVWHLFRSNHTFYVLVCSPKQYKRIPKDSAYIKMISELHDTSVHNFYSVYLTPTFFLALLLLLKHGCLLFGLDFYVVFNFQFQYLFIYEVQHTEMKRDWFRETGTAALYQYIEIVCRTNEMAHTSVFFSTDARTHSTHSRCT